MNEFNIQLSNGAKCPEKSHKSDAGFDLFAYIYDKRNIKIEPGKKSLVSTGIRLELKEGWEAQIRSRSGLALKKGIFVLNSPGTIDAGYRNIINVILYNSSFETFTVKHGDKIAQMVIKEVPNVKLNVVENIKNDTERGENGFGSTGI